MSTKIYNAFALKNISFYDIYRKTLDFSKHLEEIFKNEYIKVLADNFVENYDNFCVLEKFPEYKEYISLNDDLKKYYSSEEINHNNIYSATKHMILNKYRIVFSGKLRDPEFDFSCKVIFYPIKDKILAKLITEKEIYLNEFSKFFNASDYSFWNNTDKDDEISDEEWEQRKGDWENIDNPGFCIDVVKEYLPIVEKKEVKNIIPSLDKRLNAVAKRICLIKKTIELKKISKHCDDEMINFIHFLNIAQDFLGTISGLEYTKIEEENIKDSLRKEII